MKKLIGAAIAAGATMAGAGVANAEISANVQLTSDYVWRGVSLSDGNPAVQGGLDWNNDQFYVGTWASSLSAPAGAPNSPLEIDLYAGWTPTTGPVSWDLGVVSYNYPGADDDGAEFDYFEFKAGGAMDVIEHLNVGAAVYYSPDNYGGTGTATYWEIMATSRSTTRCTSQRRSATKRLKIRMVPVRSQTATATILGMSA